MRKSIFHKKKFYAGEKFRNLRRKGEEVEEVERKGLKGSFLFLDVRYTLKFRTDQRKYFTCGLLPFMPQRFSVVFQIKFSRWCKRIFKPKPSISTLFLQHNRISLSYLVSATSRLQLKKKYLAVQLSAVIDEFVLQFFLSLSLSLSFSLMSDSVLTSFPSHLSTCLFSPGTHPQCSCHFPLTAPGLSVYLAVV